MASKFKKNNSKKEAVDPSLPAEMVFQYSWWSQLTAFILTGLGSFLYIGFLIGYIEINTSEFLGWTITSVLLIGIGIASLIPFIRKKNASPHALKINDQWIQFEQCRPILWEVIHSVSFFQKRFPKSFPRYYLTIHTNSGAETWEITDVLFRLDGMDHILDVYQARAKKRQI